MSHERHPWKHNNHADRSDGVDGWGSPSVMLVQRALHPYLVVDRGLAENDPRALVKSGKGPDGRPCLPLRYRAGATVSRQVAMFNGSLRKRTLECQWEARWDAPTGELFRAGRSGPIELEPGFHATCPVEFALPETIERPRLLHLVLESVADGMTVFHDDSAQFQILPVQAVNSSARFVGLDQKTQGDWRGKYGTSGYEVVGSATSLPAGVQVDWSGAGTWVWAKPTDDIRAPAAQDAARVAACRYAGQLTLQVELPDKERRLSLYYVDWDRRRAKQTFTLWSEDGTQLDRREVEKAHDGCYLTWQVQGCIQITVEQEGGPNAVVSGIFLD